MLPSFLSTRVNVSVKVCISIGFMWNTFPHVVWFVLVTKLKQANTHAKDKQKKLGCKTLLWTMSFIKTTSMLNLRHYKSFWWVYVFSAVSHQSLRNSVILYFPLETEWDQIVFWSMQMKSAPCKVKQSEAEEVNSASCYQRAWPFGYCWYDVYAWGEQVSKAVAKSL